MFSFLQLAGGQNSETKKILFLPKTFFSRNNGASKKLNMFRRLLQRQKDYKVNQCCESTYDFFTKIHASIRQHIIVLKQQYKTLPRDILRAKELSFQKPINFIF
jgi:hypothetical protein